MAEESVNLSQVQNGGKIRTVSYPGISGENSGTIDPRLVAVIASAKLLIEAGKESAAMLKAWAEYCTLGGGKAVILPSREECRRAPSATDPFWIMLHVERFFDEGDNRILRPYALAAYGSFATPADARYHWQWVRPGEPARLAILRLGWGFVRDWEDPLPEIVTEFGRRFLSWFLANPMGPTMGMLEERIGDKEDPDLRLVSVRTACMLLELRDEKEGKSYPLRTVRDWCAKGKFKGARKVADWVIPVGVLRDFERPRPGRKKRKKLKKGLAS